MDSQVIAVTQDRVFQAIVVTQDLADIRATQEEVAIADIRDLEFQDSVDIRDLEFRGLADIQDIAADRAHPILLTPHRIPQQLLYTLLWSVAWALIKLPRAIPHWCLMPALANSVPQILTQLRI